MQHLWKAGMTLAGALVLAGCSPSGSSSIDQSNLCIASTDERAMQCPEGELILARLNPNTSELRAYNVLNTIALYCDTNHRIVHNDAGVVCVLTKQRLESVTGRQPAADGSGQSSADTPAGAS